MARPMPDEAELASALGALTVTPNGAAPSIATFARTASMPEVIAAIERDGGAIVRDFIGPGLLQELQSDMKTQLSQASAGSREDHPLYRIFHGNNTTRFCGLAGKSRAFVELLGDARLRVYADHFLLPHCGGYWLNTGQMMIVGPGEPSQLLHRDSANWPHFPWPTYEVTVSCMFALNDFTLENGATQVVPGSHQWADAQRVATAAEVTQAVMPAGSVLLYTGNVIHAAGQNRTKDELRFGMHLSWVLGWLRPEECHWVAVPAETARRLPARVQALLGYHSYYPSGMGGRLGLVDFEDAKLAFDAKAD